jgi:hypothetical protein
MQIAFIVFGCSVFYLMHVVKPNAETPPAPALYESIAAVAVADGFIGIMMHRLLLKAKARPLPNGRMPTGAERWLSANVVRLAFATSTSLFGFVLHVLGAPERLAQILVGLGILYMLMPPGALPAEQPALPYTPVE